MKIERVQLRKRYIARTLQCCLALGFLALCASPLAAQRTTAAHDGEFLDVSHVYTLGEDGSITYNYGHRLRLLTSFGFTRQYGESFVIYDPARQSLTIDSTRTRMAGGAIVESPFNAFNDVLPAFAHNAAPWSGMREMVVTHTGLERGAVVHFGYTLTSRAGMYPGLSARILLGDRSPVHRVTVRVRVPKSVVLAHALVGHATAQPVRTDEGRMAVYTWTLENIPVLAVETQQPPMDMVLPVLFVSTSSMRDLVVHALGGQGSMDLTDDALRLVKGITAASKNVIDKVRALQAHVATTVGSMPADLQFIGFRSRPAMQTFTSNVGSTLDRAVLLTAMLRAADIAARPVLTSPYLSADATAWSVGAVPMSLACPHLYTSAAVEVTVDGATFVLDPTEAQGGRVPSRLARGAYLPLDAGSLPPGALPLPGGTQMRRATIVSDWTLSADLMVTGKSRVEVEGPAAADLDPGTLFGRARPVLIPSGSGLSFAKETCASPKPGAAYCDVSVTSTALRAFGGLVTIPIPHPVGGLTDLHLALAPMMRTTPVLIGRQEETVRMTLHLPAGVTAQSAARIDLQNSVGEVRSVVKADAHAVEVERSIRIIVPVVSPDQYADLRALLAAWQARAQVELPLRVSGL